MLTVTVTRGGSKLVEKPGRTSGGGAAVTNGQFMKVVRSLEDGGRRFIVGVFLGAARHGGGGLPGRFGEVSRRSERGMMRGGERGEVARGAAAHDGVNGGGQDGAGSGAVAKLAISGECHHDLRDTQGEVIAAIHLPKVYNLTPDEAGVRARAVVDQALPEFLVLVAAEVVRLHLPRHVVPVEMKPDHNIGLLGGMAHAQRCWWILLTGPKPWIAAVAVSSREVPVWVASPGTSGCVDTFLPSIFV
nr:hypothetical protein Iba_chr12dCG5400 [Ipomoea batatas]